MVAVAQGPLIHGEPLLRWRAITLTEVILALAGKLGVAKPYVAEAGLDVLGTVKSAEFPSCTKAYVGFVTCTGVPMTVLAAADPRVTSPVKDTAGPFATWGVIDDCRLTVPWKPEAADSVTLETADEPRATLR